ncbi:hypothetical protein DFH07DRAFT_961854 [Mycena maculata]|uniref:Uncharacterized protein n=1 Tax=Mycena maculata TaxID=230809 RepID=A0AAD7IRX7_9AGAR|nr:hypothetical protein DFH07DRAFT_961854 [Mycena maculata]
MASPQQAQLHLLAPGLREEDLISLRLHLPTVERTLVVRPLDVPPQVKTPRHMWIIPSRDSMYLPSAGSDLMIRQEYNNILAAVLSSLYCQSRVAQLKWDFPDLVPVPTDQMNVDNGSDIEPDHMRIPNNPPDVFEENIFPNPFEHPCHGRFYRHSSALIITGLPGIGKALFLSVIFYLRAAAGLLTASSLQPQVCSGVEIQAFFEKFGGSARHIYQDCQNLLDFDNQVNESALPLDNKVIHRIMAHTSPTVAVDDLVGHMLITAFPLDDEDRRKFRLTSPTPYLEEKLLRQLNDNVQIARQELYVINMGVATPGCKATAGDLLDKHHHGFIALGGKWCLREFTKVGSASSTTKINLWWASEDDSEWILEANGKMSVFREAKPVRPPCKKRAITEFTGLTTVNFPSANVTHLQKDHYYRPSQTNFLTFDSFYMDKKGHGLTFQASEGDKKPHTVNDGGREWLEQRGIAKFTYILVSSPKMGAPPSISVPRDHEAKFDHFFHLVLEYPELKKLLLA